MKKTIIAAAIVSLLYVSDSMAQNRRGGGQQNRMSADSSQTTRRGRGNRELLAEKDLPANGISAIKSQYPDAQMKRIMKNKKGNYNVVLTQTDKPRRMLEVDGQGSIVNDREMPARGGHGGRGRKNKK
ncbi:MAG: hypothetical protein H7319_15325 [Spirosoma sp.]|nr:hypothetical protein [Spirosoma sp.]